MYGSTWEPLNSYFEKILFHSLCTFFKKQELSPPETALPLLSQVTEPSSLLTKQKKTQQQETS